jgi:hypothetical protein
MKIVTILLLLISLFSCRNYPHNGPSRQSYRAAVKAAKIALDDALAAPQESEESNRIQENWVMLDSLYLIRVVNVLKYQPHRIDKFVKPEGSQVEKLGFGYQFVKSSMGKGYGGVHYEMIFKGKHLLCYQLWPSLPIDERLQERYIALYSSFFKFDSTGNALPFEWQMTKASLPLVAAYNYPVNAAIEKQFNYLMSPTVGIAYGGRFENRSIFEQIRLKLDTKAFEKLLYSINPATRLLAVEYYKRNRALFLEQQAEIEARIKVIFQAVPEITTVYSDLIVTESATELVDKMLKVNE